MNVIITGGGGFIGSQLAKALLEKGKLTLQPHPAAIAITKITLVDILIPDAVKRMFEAAKIPVAMLAGDIASPAFISTFFPSEITDGKAKTSGPPRVVIFHLASIVSGMGEKNFDLAMSVNFDATRDLLERSRRHADLVRFVFTSSIATFGGHAMTPVVSDTTKQIPQTTYGMTKLIGELMINDYSRKGFLDGRSARLPTIFIRPGKPNAAASSFASSVFREPLNGKRTDLPVGEQGVPLLSYMKVVDCLIKLMEADAALLGDDRAVGLPSTQYTLHQMIATLKQVAEKRGIKLGPIVDTPDPVIQRIVSGWPVGTDGSRGAPLGMTSDASLESVIERFIEDFPPSANL